MAKGSCDPVSRRAPRQHLPTKQWCVRRLALPFSPVFFKDSLKSVSCRTFHQKVFWQTKQRQVRKLSGKEFGRVRKPPLIGIRDRKGAPKNLYDKYFAELWGGLSGAIRLKTLDLLGSALELFRKFLGIVRAIFWLWGSFFGR